MAELPIEGRAGMTFKAAVAKALSEHARLGPPAYIWRKQKSCKAIAKGGSGLLEINAPQIDFAA